MKKHIIPILVTFLSVVVAFMSGWFFGRKISGPDIVVTSFISDGPTEATTKPKNTEEEIAVSFPIDINTASYTELMALPGIGEVLAQRIVDYRTEHGPFEAVERIKDVNGISDKRFEDIKDLICIGGQ